MKRRLLAACILAAATSAAAQSGQRTGKWDLSLVAPYTGSESYSAAGGANTAVEAGWGLGFALNYGLNEKWAVGGELGWRTASYRATAVPAGNSAGLPAEFSGRASNWWLKATGTYHFRPGWHTPYVTGGLGALHVDSGIAAGPPIGGCVYYWYGTYCEGGAPTYNSTRLNYSLGVGYRWDLQNRFIARASVEEQWYAGNLGGTQSWAEYRLQFGFKF